jgi:hypothetical protein
VVTCHTHSPPIANGSDDVEATPAYCTWRNGALLRDAKRTVLDFDPCHSVRVDGNGEGRDRVQHCIRSNFAKSENEVIQDVRASAFGKRFA